MANPTTNYGFVLPTSTDLVTDLPADFDVALQGVDTRLKALQPGTTLGDLAYSSATANTNTRLGIGTTGQVLSVTAGVPAWATPSAAVILQVKQTAKTDTFTSTSTSYVDITGLSVSITPSSATNKVLVMMTVQGAGDLAASTMGLQLMRGATAIGIGDSAGSRRQASTNAYSAGNDAESMSITFLDSPATTSATTYKIQGVTFGAGTFFINRSEGDNNNAEYGRFASTITVMEISA
jgi:hypothetical protein